MKPGPRHLITRPEERILILIVLKGHSPPPFPPPILPLPPHHLPPAARHTPPPPPPPLLQVGSATVPFRPEWDRVRLTPPHTAYLRVAEGCNHACTFCAIPGFRCARRPSTACLLLPATACTFCAIPGLRYAATAYLLLTVMPPTACYCLPATACTLCVIPVLRYAATACLLLPASCACYCLLSASACYCPSASACLPQPVFHHTRGHYALKPHRPNALKPHGPPTRNLKTPHHYLRPHGSHAPKPHGPHSNSLRPQDPTSFSETTRIPCSETTWTPQQFSETSRPHIIL